MDLPLTDGKPEKKISEIKRSEWAEFQFIEHQLGVVDTKAGNVLTLDSILIVISTLTTLFGANMAIAYPSYFNIRYTRVVDICGSLCKDNMDQMGK